MDKRTKTYKIISKWKDYTFSGEMACTLILSLLAGLILGKSFYGTHKASPQPTEQKKEIVVVKVVEAVDTPFCFDPITCIRDVGESLGEPNSHITTMIRIARAESNFRADGMNKNKNGTFDLGIFMINDVHGKRISRADRLDFQKNIRFAYQLHREQKHSFTAWVVYNKGLAK